MRHGAAPSRSWPARKRAFSLSTLDRFLADDGADVWADFAADGRLDDVADARPSRPGEAIGAALAATLELAPGETRLVSFVLAWDLPVVEFGAGTCWYKRYTRFFGRGGDNAWAIGAEALAKRTEWSSAIDAWQAPILADTARPDWYKGALFNELYFLVDGGTVWTDGKPFRPRDAADAGGDAPEPEGRARRLAGPLRGPGVLRLPVLQHARRQLLRLVGAPAALARPRRRRRPGFRGNGRPRRPRDRHRGLAGHPRPEKRRGALPHDLGAPNEDPFLRPNSYTWRDINIWKDLNSKFVLQVWRDVQFVPAPELARETWPAVVQAMDYLAEYDRDGDGLPEHDGQPDQTYDMWSMRGPGAYTGALWLAALRAAIRLGEMVGDCGDRRPVPRVARSGQRVLRSQALERPQLSVRRERRSLL